MSSEEKATSGDASDAHHKPTLSRGRKQISQPKITAPSSRKFATMAPIPNLRCMERYGKTPMANFSPHYFLSLMPNNMHIYNYSIIFYCSRPSLYS